MYLVPCIALFDYYGCRRIVSLPTAYLHRKKNKQRGADCATPKTVRMYPGRTLRLSSRFDCGYIMASSCSGN